MFHDTVFLGLFVNIVGSIWEFRAVRGFMVACKQPVLYGVMKKS